LDPPPPINFVHDHFFLISIHNHVAAALGPLECAGRSARPRHVAAALGPLAAALGPLSAALGPLVRPSRSAWPRNELNLTEP